MSRRHVLVVLLICLTLVSGLRLRCAAAASVKVRVSLSARHPISPYVYGVNFATQTMLDWGVGANRQSGDASSMYNWKLDITNSANDGFWRTAEPFRPFQPPTPANSSFLDLMFTRTAAAGSVFVQPLQAVGWVSRSRADCFSFPVSVYGPQQRHEGDAGDGVLANGTQLAGDWRCYRPYGVGDNSEWLSHMEQLLGRQRLQSQLWLQTADNEPDCFSPVHRDAHPLNFGYDEMWATIAGFGAMIKAQYPLLQLNGPSWSNYCWWYWVRGDGCGGTDGVDYKQHGGQYSTAWLMQRMDDYYVATGIKLLDIVDVHHYPMYPVEVPERDDSEEQQQAILDSVRTFWDWTYVVPGSDLARCGERCLGPAAAILPRMVGEVRRYTPHMQLKLTVSEFALGFNDSCYTGALAVAEALALFGYWDVYMGARWLSPAEGSKAEQAFKLFLNYDGQGRSIRGDSVNTSSSASPNHTAYTVYDPQLQTLYSLLFNRQLDAQGSSVFSVLIGDAKLADGRQQQDSAVYSMTPAAWQLSPSGQTTVSLSSAGDALSFSVTVSPRSLSLVVVQSVQLADGVQSVRLWQPDTGPSLEERHARLLAAETKLGRLTAEDKRAFSQAGLHNRRRHAEKQAAAAAGTAGRVSMDRSRSWQTCMLAAFHMSRPPSADSTQLSCKPA